MSLHVICCLVCFRLIKFGFRSNPPPGEPCAKGQQSKQNQFSESGPHALEQGSEHRNWYNSDTEHEKPDENSEEAPKVVGKEQTPHPKGETEHI